MDNFSVSILSSLFINIFLFLLLTFLCSHCLHLFVYIYARLLCSPFELAEGSSQSNLAGIRVKSKRAAASQSYGKQFSVRSCCRMY